MKAGNFLLLQDFIGLNKVIFQIPVYQRNYDWSEENVKRLLDDLKTIIDTSEKHFLGTIVYLPHDDDDDEVLMHEYIIIDGQQRLTTVMLVLKALMDLAAASSQDTHDDINDNYLHNRNCKPEYRVKLRPSREDRQQLGLLLKDDGEEMDHESHIYLNYQLIRKRLAAWLESGIRPGKILVALGKLEMVFIQLKEGVDDPQIIFESINSTGLALSNADLIRNFLLMSDRDQERLYEEYWVPIEKALKHGTNYSNLNLFFVQYIVYRTNAPVTEGNLYVRFVKLFHAQGYTHESCLQELKYFAEIFKSFVYDGDDYPAMVTKYLRGIRLTKKTTAYPFLLHVFDDYAKNVMDAKTLGKVVQLVFIYLLRRSVCGVPSNSLRGFFTYLYARVFKVESNKKKYYEALNKFLFTLTTRDVMPSDTEFERALNHGNVYSNLPTCKFLLMDLENGDGKETLNPDDMTIEHIMPQTLGSEWQHISPAEHEEYLHVLGNLSVTGYNSELSNKSFAEKKKIIRENSKAVVLNGDVWDKDDWTIADIKARGQRLAAMAMQRYAVSAIQDDSINFEYLETIDLAHGDEVTNKRLAGFRMGGSSFVQNTFIGMLIDVVKMLDKRNPGVLEKLAEADYVYSSHASYSTLSEEKDKIKESFRAEVKPGIYLNTHYSARGVMACISALMEAFDEDKNDFSIFVIAAEGSETENDEEDDENEEAADEE